MWSRFMETRRQQNMAVNKGSRCGGIGGFYVKQRKKALLSLRMGENSWQLTLYGGSPLPEGDGTPIIELELWYCQLLIVGFMEWKT